MALDDDIRILAGVSLFAGFTPEQLRLLAFGAESFRLGAGRQLFEEGAEADSAYVVVRGEMLLHRDRGGERVTVGRAGAGVMLGELALIAETSRLTSASAAVDTDLIRLSRRLFRRILEEYPDVAVMLRDRIAGQMQSLIRSIEALGPRFAG